MESYEGEVRRSMLITYTDDDDDDDDAVTIADREAARGQLESRETRMGS